jgi:predicted glutamine amidotransferase
MICHIRYGTVQPLDSTTNAHSFTARVAGQDWVLAHNGYLSGIKSSTSSKRVYVPAGSTDSEFFFAVLVDRLAQGGSRAAAIAEVTKEFSAHGKLNFLLSNGHEYYFFANGEGGLYYKNAEGTVYVATVPVGN